MGRIGNIINKKGKMDSQRAKIFTKYARLISVAAKAGGGDPEYNAALKNAIDKAKSENMPNDNIDRAVKKGIGGGNNDNYEHITYEGYGPGGVAVIVETLTDNKNRTAGNIRYYFDKNGGNLGTSGSVSFMFDRKGQILIEKASNIQEEDLMDASLEAGADDFISDEEGYVILTTTENFNEVKNQLASSGYNFVSADIELIPQTYSQIEEQHKKSMDKLIEMLEDDDDVQNIFHNIEEN